MLDFDPVWLPTMIASFLVFMVLFNAILIKPLLRVVTERDEKIRSALKQAEEAEARRAETVAKVEAELLAARNEARAAIETARQAGAEEQRKLIDAAHKQAEAASKKAKEEIAVVVKAAQEKLRSDAESLAGEIVGKLVGRA